jgi:hypothetical protein
LRALLAADIIIATPEKWDGISRNWQSRGYVKKVDSRAAGEKGQQCYVFGCCVLQFGQQQFMSRTHGLIASACMAVHWQEGSEGRNNVQACNELSLHLPRQNSYFGTKYRESPPSPEIVESMGLAPCYVSLLCLAAFRLA